MSANRRLAAILVADVVGYSRLIGGDETGTLARLHLLRRDIIEPSIRKHSGRLFKVVGDGFLVEFASAVQAVTCAIAIQDEVEAIAAGQVDTQRMRLRIGVHVGDVLVQGDDLMGDGVNIAARIESIAEPGGIMISRPVHDQVRDRIDDDEGISLLDRAIEHDPNLALAWEIRGVCKGGQGEIDEAIPDFEQALRLNPRDPRRWVSQHGLAWVYLLAGRYDDAVSLAQKVLHSHPDFGFTIRVLVAAHALAGRLDKAHEALRTHMVLEEGARISTIRPSYLRRVTPQAFEVLAHGLRKAGFPE
jgi:tetratricopeptide (TPR) repeat protein